MSARAEAAPAPANAVRRDDEDMAVWRGLWLPARERHLLDWMAKVNVIVDGKPTYQYRKLEAALRYVREWRCALDIGAHVGLWAMHLVKRFQTVIAFEPVELHRRCFMRNVGAEYDGRCQLYDCALGAVEGVVTMRSLPTSSGDTVVDWPDAGAGTVPLRRLDDVLAPLQPVDFVKLDCEGYELLALNGGEAMLRRCKPAIIVEQKPGKAQQFFLPETGAVEYLRGLGAVLRQEISGDFIMSWD